MKCVCVWLGAVCEMRGMGLGFTNAVGAGGVWDMCMCLCCGSVCDVGGGHGSGRVGWSYVCVYC